MNKIIAVLSLLSLIAIFLQPVHLHAGNLRVSNSPSFNQNNSQMAQNQPTTGDIRDILGPVEIPKPAPYLLYFLVTLLVFICVIVTFFLLKGRRTPPQSIPDPASVALAELAREESKLKESGSNRFASKISSILRSYIEQRFMIPSTRQTTSEFFSRLTTTVTDGSTDISAHRENLEECLRLCDLAKYAHFEPEDGAASHLAETVREFISATRKKEGAV